MVLEQLYSVKWLEQKARYAFLMGFVYALMGMVSALFLFPKDPGLVSVAFTSLLLLPSLSKLLSLEENKDAREDEVNFWLIIDDHWDLFKVYVFLFLGILMAYGFFTVAMPAVAGSTLFAEQLRLLGLTGQAVGTFSGFKAIFANNFKVLLFCFLASFFYGSGAVFIITWNASVWGAVFGMIAKNAPVAAGNGFAYFFLTILAVMPHMLTEASAYILAAIAGGVISKGAIREEPFSPIFTRILQDAMVVFTISLMVLLISVYIEEYVTEILMSVLGV